MTYDPELDRIIRLNTRTAAPSVEKLTTLSADTIERNFPHLIVKMSPRRKGMSMRNALAIARGEAVPAA
jgi:hypothetical protein